MFTLPYETTPNGSYQTEEIRKALLHALISGELRPVVSGSKHSESNGEILKGVQEVPPYLKSIPAFSQPMWVENDNNKMLVIDSRAFVREGRDGSIKITNPTEYRFLTLRAILTRAWIEGSKAEQSQFGDYPATVFSRILTEGLVRRLGLSPMDQMNLSVISAYYYFSLFLSVDAELTDIDRVKLATRVSRATRVAVDKVMALTDQLPILGDINAYSAALKEAVGSTRLSKLNAGLIYAIVGGCWFGAHARESVAISLEYPPIFLAMLYMALTDRSYHSAFFTKTALSTDKEAARQNFTKSMGAYLNEVGYV